MVPPWHPRVGGGVALSARAVGGAAVPAVVAAAASGQTPPRTTGELRCPVGDLDVGARGTRELSLESWVGLCSLSLLERERGSGAALRQLVSSQSTASLTQQRVTFHPPGVDGRVRGSA